MGFRTYFSYQSCRYNGWYRLLSRMKGGADMANIMMTAVYNQFSTTYMQKKAVGRYDTHKRSELRTLCSSMAKVNRDAPLYLIDNSTDAKRFVIGLKEDARELHNTIVSTMGDVENAAFNNKIAYSTNTNIVSAKYIGEQKALLPGTSDEASGDGSVTASNGAVPSYEIEVTSLASPQVNLGNFVPKDELELAPGEYSFDISVNDMGYEFQFNINEGDTNQDVQKRLARLINNSKIGLNASVEENEDSLSALRIESARVGIDYGQSSEVFTVSDRNTSMLSGAVEYFGLDYTAREASNARFTVNGMEASATSNNFILQNTYEISLNGLSENEGQTTTIGLKPDTEAFHENISTLIGGYNNFIRSVSEFRDTQARSSHLIKEMNRITGFYQQEMEKLGISSAKDGTLEINDEQLSQVISNEETPEALSSLKAFSQSMLRKSSQISLNPVNYMNKTVVAYKNPDNTFLSPYVTSAYSGMFFNNYC